MDVNIAALTLMCLAFTTGLLLVVSFIEKPIFPLIASPQTSRDRECDVRETHSIMQSCLRRTGPGIMVPITGFATLAAAVQSFQRGYDVLSIFVVIGTLALMILAGLAATPAARRVRDADTYEDDFETVATPLFRLARLHHTMLLAIIPLTLAQLALLFY